MPTKMRGGAKRITTLSSREFNRHTSRAKQAAKRGPVLITDRGRPAHVLLTIEEYWRLTDPPSSVIDLLALPGAEDVEFASPRVGGVYRVGGLSS